MDQSTGSLLVGASNAGIIIDDAFSSGFAWISAPSSAYFVFPMGGRSSKTGTEATVQKKDEGQPTAFDANFKGPIKNRSCTDIPCCIIFVIFILAFIGVAIYAFAMGDPRFLVYPIDSSGNLCGTGRFSNKPYLLYFNLIECALGTGALPKDLQNFDVKNFQFKICPTPQVCVSDCPDYYWAPAISDPTKAICKYNVTKPQNTNSAIDAVKKEDCAPFIVPSKPVVYRCLPAPIVFNPVQNVSGDFNGTRLADRNNNTVTANQLKQAISNMTTELNVAQDYGIKILGDVTASWWLILIFITIAMVVSFVWIVLMRWLAGVIVWLSIILFVGFFIFAIYYCFNKYVQLKDTTSQWIVTQNLSYYANLKETWLALGIIAVIVLVIMLLLLVFLINRLRIAIALIKEASRAIGYMISILFWPLIPYIMQVCVIAFWGASAICLAAISKTSRDACYIYRNTTLLGSNDTQAQQYADVRCWFSNQFKKVPCNISADGFAGSSCRCLTLDDCDVRYTYVLQAFQLFMWFWVMNFIIAVGQLTLAGAFASYYWAFHKPKDIPLFPVFSSFGRAFRYHTGSMAFGALLIAIVQLIIAILTYIDHKLKGRENTAAKFILKCLICCFYCLEKLLKFINKNAYIMIAVYGKNFCVSAKNAFSLLLRNLIRVVVVDKVTDLLLFVSKLFVVAAVGVLAYFFFAREIPGIDRVIPTLQLNYYLIPVLIIICAAYIVASAFFNVYSMGIDTLFLCFLEDLERHDGSAEKPYYMNKELMNILGKKNKASKQA